MTIECAFGRLKGRFGALCRPIDLKLSDLPMVIHSCFVLHNICELNREQVNDHLFQDARVSDVNSQPACLVNRCTSGKNEPEGKRTRDVYVQYFE